MSPPRRPPGRGQPAGAPTAPEAAHAARHGGGLGQVVVRVGRLVVREAGGDQGLLQPLAPRDGQAFAVAVRAVCAHGSEQLVPQRIQRHSDEDLGAVHGGQAHAEHGITVREVVGAIQRIHEPSDTRAFLLTALLTMIGMVREALFQSADDQLFGRMIGVGDQIVGAALVRLTVSLAVRLDHQLARLTGYRHREFEHVIEVVCAFAGAHLRPRLRLLS